MLEDHRSSRRRGPLTYRGLNHIFSSQIHNCYRHSRLLPSTIKAISLVATMQLIPVLLGIYAANHIKPSYLVLVINRGRKAYAM